MATKNIKKRVFLGLIVVMFLSTAFISYDDLVRGTSSFFTNILYWEFFIGIVLFYFIRDFKLNQIVKVGFLLLILFLLESVLISERYAEFLLRFLLISFLAGGVKWYADQRYKKNDLNLRLILGLLAVLVITSAIISGFNRYGYAVLIINSGYAALIVLTIIYLTKSKK